MKLIKLMGLTFLSLLLTNGIKAQQPYNGCWHPTDIKNWSPQNDPNAKFNRSRVALAKRFKEPALMKANKNQYYEGQVCNASILYPMCSLCPSQGANNFIGYQPTYWQYMDKMVYWAGAANEGIINIPPCGSTDAAHQSGVKMLGNIFFPPSAYGGQRLWVQQMLTRENGKYIYAKKLFEIAKYFGFDGWFINEETGGGTIDQWVQFIKEFNEYADAEGYKDMEIQWYEAFRGPNTRILTSHKNTSHFLDYGRVNDYRNMASTLGCTEQQVMEKIYGGIETVQQGMTGYGNQLRNVFKRDKHVGSVALFCPEEHIWKGRVKHLLDTPQDNGEEAYKATTKVFENENIVWVNRNNDPSVISDEGMQFSSWPGISGCLLERSSITSLPFKTSFCVGVGKYRFVKGEKRNKQDWYHSGTQSIMPTWRYWIENAKKITTSLDWDDAYNFGNSLKISGFLTQGNHLMRLYKTQINITQGGTFKLVYKTNKENSVDVKLGTESDVNNGLIKLDNVRRTTTNGWTIDEYDLAAFNTKTIYMIALDLKADNDIENYELKLGELSMLPSSYQPKAMNVSKLTNGTTLTEEGGDLRLTWDWEDNADFDHFDIYTVNDKNEAHLVGQTRGEGFYVPKFQRNGLDKAVNVRLVPVMKDGSESNVQQLKVEYPKLTEPVITIKTNKSYVKKGDIVVLTANGTGEPTSWKWTLPSSLEPLNNAPLTNSSITVRTLQEGEQKVKVEATNVIGTGMTEQVVFDVLNEADFKDIKNVALKKKVESFNGSASNDETPINIIDGIPNPTDIHKKWCNIGTNHECVIDLLGAYRLYGFKIYDCKSGPEIAENFDKYRISVSEDGVNWTLVVNEKNRLNDNIKIDYITPLKARYVKLNPYSDKGMTLRMWEFEVLGSDLSKMTIETPDQIILKAGEKQTVEVKYMLNGDQRSPQFQCEVSTIKGDVVVSNVKDDEEKSTITFTVTASTKIGNSKVKVLIRNGEISKERIFNVVVDDPSARNILQGVKSEIRKYSSNYSSSETYSVYENTLLTDGDVSNSAFGDEYDFCKYNQDLWSVFEATDMWNVSKVKITIKDNNKGEDDNEKEGLVYKNIDIMASNNGYDWETIYTFKDIKEQGTLQYILPRVKKTKFLAIVSTLHPLFYPSITEIEAFEQAGKPVSEVVPLKIDNGFNADVIAETQPVRTYTNETLDSEGWVFYTSKIKPEGALCDDSGTIIATSGNEYQLGDLESNNALVMKNSLMQYKLIFETPQYGSELNLLVLSTGGRGGMMVVPIYEDETTGNTERFGIDDWFTATNEVAKDGLGKIKRENRGSFKDGDIHSQQQFKLIEHKINIDSEKRIKAIRVRNTEPGKIVALLAASIKTAVPTGINNTNNDSDVKIIGIYTIDGLRLTTPVKGINIFKLSNGTVKKVFIK
ncbi:MAG: endo-beta-N-acetylglucosaminidase [Prevotella sp.]